MDYARAVSLKMSASQRTPNTGQNWSKLIDLVMQLEQLNATIFKFSQKFDHSFSHVFIFIYLVTCFQIVTVSLLCRLQGKAISSPCTNRGINNIGTYIFNTACNRHSNETMTLRKHVTKYININTWENGWSNISENFIKVALKLLELTQFASANISIYINFIRCCGPLCYRAIFRTYSIYREVYGFK